jgi:REP element-mobilizing transposase RayT
MHLDDGIKFFYSLSVIKINRSWSQIMPRVNRREIVADGEIQVFHVINRCVRRTHLCGRDRRSRKDYSHRKDWLRERLEFLAGVFGVEVLGFAVMSNHLHVVTRTRPDVVKAWSDDEVARRWWSLFPKRTNRDKSAAEPTKEELDKIQNNAAGVKEKRRRLSNLSWFMKCLCEPIAKRANKEEKVTGHFWESRFKAQPLLDEMAIAACMAYVDLNPIRAGIAESPETSLFTSVGERIKDRQAVKENRGAETPLEKMEHEKHAGWLAPIELTPASNSDPEPSSTRRASSRGCLGITLDRYLQLIDWTGRQLRQDKPGAILKGLPEILERLDCSVDTWLSMVRNFRRMFKTEAGKPESLAGISSLRRSCRVANQRG